METASSMIAAQAHEDANIIWGAAFDEDMTDEMSVTVIGDGLYLPRDQRLPSGGPSGLRSGGRQTGKRRCRAAGGLFSARRTGKNHAGALCG